MIGRQGPVSRGASKTSVRWKRLLAACALLSALSVAGRASIIDPQMGMEGYGDSTPFNGTATLGPDASGGGFIAYFNNTGQNITSLTFIADNITPAEFAGATFTCNGASDPIVPNPFFLFCSIDYFSSDDLLEFIFSGTLPGPGGLDLGIPPGSNFAISFNTNYSLTVDGGGWGSVGNPSFTATDTQTSLPEPGSAPVVGAALLAGVSLLSLRRRLKKS